MPGLKPSPPLRPSAVAVRRGGSAALALLLAGARYDAGVDIRHDGKPVPSQPHIDMTVAMLREHAVEVDDSDDRMQKKIRTHTTQKVPYLLIAGEDDRANGAVSFRFRDGSQHNGVPIAHAVDAIVDWVASRANTDPTAEALRVAG